MKPFLLVIALLCLIACNKDGGDTQKPVIVLNTPTANQQFPASSTVTISGTISDDDGIHEVHVEVTNKNTSTAVLHVQEHVDAKSYTINEVFTARAGITYKIHIEAHDHVGNIGPIDIEVKGN